MRNKIKGSQIADLSSTLIGGRRRETMVVVGDSITDRLLQSANGSGVGTGFRDSAYGGTSYAFWGNIFLNWRFDFLQDAGESGDTMPGMLTRYDSQVTPHNPDWVFIFGGTNDINTMSAGTELEGMWTRLMDLVDRAYVRGHKVAIGNLPMGSYMTAASKRGITMAYNNRIERFCVSNGLPMADFFGAVTDPATEQLQTEFQSDLVHPSARGAVRMGWAFARAFQNVPRVSQTPRSFGRNPYGTTLNPAMVGNNAGGSNGWTTSTAVTGNGPDWFVATTTIATAGALANSKITHPTLAGQSHRMVCTSDATSASQRFYLDHVNGVKFTAAWTSSGATTAFGSGAQVVRTSAGDIAGVMYLITTGGTWGATDVTASWSKNIGDTVTDGTVTLRVIRAVYSRTRFSTSLAVNAAKGTLISTATGERFGVAYLVTGSGTLGATDDTATWSTNLNASVTSGTATLRVVPAFRQETTLANGSGQGPDYMLGQSVRTSTGTAAATPVLYVVTTAGTPTTGGTNNNTASAWSTTAGAAQAFGTVSFVVAEISNFTPITAQAGLTVAPGPKFIRTPKGDLSGVVYAVTTGGALATTLDTDTWTSLPGATITSGTAVLTVMPAYAQKLQGEATYRLSHTGSNGSFPSIRIVMRDAANTAVGQAMANNYQGYVAAPPVQDIPPAEMAGGVMCTPEFLLPPGTEAIEGRFYLWVAQSTVATCDLDSFDIFARPF